MPSNDTSIRDLPDRKWGIELEVLRSANRDHLREAVEMALRRAGIRDRQVAVARYTHDGPNNRVWKWKPDGSCGYELCSPVLSSWAGLKELKAAMNAVDAYGSEFGVRLVNKSCGVHVHVDCRDLRWRDIKNLIFAMKIWEPIFYAMNPHSRKGNHFCIEMNISMERIKNARNKDQIRDAWNSYENAGGDRRHGLNLTPWWDRGSVEFRYFAGTFAFEKAVAAIMVSLLLVEAVKLKGSVRITDEQLNKNFNQIWAMAGGIGLENFAERFFRDFLVVRSGGCPVFAEFIKYVRTRILTFYESNGNERGHGRGRNSVAGTRFA